MKILFFITRSDTIGGAQIHVRDLSKLLIKKGHEVVVATGASGSYTIELERNGIKSVAVQVMQQKINPIEDGKTVFYFKQIIHEFQPDIISTHSSKAGFIGRLVSKLTNKPCLFTVHGWAFTEGVPEPSRTVYEWLERQVETWADKIICVSEYDRQLGIKVGMNPYRLLTIHNGMPDISDELRANPSVSYPVKIVMVARFDRQKDHLTLIKALPSFSGVQLLLVGDGPKLQDLKKIVEQMKIADRVKFLGYCDNVAEILAQAQIFTLISNWEGFPRSIVEAMRAGLPVIASNVGGVNEAVIDGVTGYCVPRGDIDILRERLSKLITEPGLRQAMGERGRQRYESEFTFQHMYEKTFEVYEKILTERRKTSE